VPNYDAAFFQYVNSGAIRSARQLLPLLRDPLVIRSVLDVGCGQGAWLSVWRGLGAEVVGIDGSYVDKSALLIPEQAFVAHDLTQSFDLGRRFDLVQSLEVAEHLPASKAAEFVACLVRHGELVLFSAAAKGQGGDHHVNEQDYDYWRALFAQHGYVAIDYLRPLVRLERDIEPWYRYNALLYVARERFEHLPEALRRARVAENERIRDVSPMLYRARKACTMLLPTPVATSIAKLKERMVAMARRSSAGAGS
jgi:SAM-dependent methyltransferase